MNILLFASDEKYFNYLINVHKELINRKHNSLFLYTIKRLSATFTTLVDYIVPIVGILVGYIFLNEIVDSVFFITLILIFISLYLAVKDEARNLSKS